MRTLHEQDIAMNIPHSFKVLSLLLAIASLTQLSGCMAIFGAKDPSLASQSQIPDWVQRPPGDDAVNIYGIGEGRDLEGAKQSALKDVAGKLATHIQSESENRDYLFNGQGSSSFKQKVNTEIKKMKLSNFEVLQASQSGQLIYAMVALPRASFVADKQKTLNELNAQIDAQLKGVEGKNRLVQLQRYHKSIELADQARPLVALIEAADQSQNLRSHIARYRDFAQKEQQLLEKSKIFIKPNASLSAVVHHLKGLLQSQGLQVGDRSGADGILEVKGSMNQAELFSSKTVKIDVDLAMLTPTGQSLSRTKYTLSGSSVSSYDTARQNALSHLDKKLASREALYSLFGADQN